MLRYSHTDSTERAFILSFSWVLGVWRCLPDNEKGDEVLSFLMSELNSQIWRAIGNIYIDERNQTLSILR